METDGTDVNRAHRYAQLKGDIAGGLVSALVAIPLAIGYGMFAFVALGDQYFAHGMLAGLTTAIVVALVCVALGERATAVYAPRVITTFFLGAIIVNSLLASNATIMGSGDVRLILAVVFAIVLLGGAIQVLFGLTGVGTLLKHTPHPVMAGFQNAAALLLGLVQCGNLLGFEHHVAIGKVLDHVGEARPLSLLVALVAALAMWNAKRVAPKLPPLLAGLAAGTLAYYALAAAGLGAQLGPVLGGAPPITAGLATLPAFLDLVRHPQWLELVPAVLTSALSLALVASIDALLCARLLQGPGGGKPDDDRQLVRLGLGNMAAACVGGITSGFNLGPSLANRAFGARTRRSVLVNAAVTLLTLLALLPLIAGLPRAALSGAIVVIAIQHFDPWTVQAIRRLAGRDVIDWKRAALDLSVALLVALLAIVADIVVAVLAGFLIAVAFFLERMSRSIVRRSWRADTIHSRRMRDPALMRLLASQGARIAVVELEGAVFFGTTEALLKRVEQELSQATTTLILDFRRVSEVDSSGAQSIVQIANRLSRSDTCLLLSGLGGHSTVGRTLLDMGVIESIGAEHAFPDCDRALEWAENRLITAAAGTQDATAETALERLDLLARFSAEERSVVQHMLKRREYRRGELVVREGEPGTELFIVVRGSATGTQRTAGGREARLMTFAAGTVFGELGLVDQEVRSATVTADDALACLVLTRTDFVAMTRMYPSVAVKLLANLSRELAVRLRRANRTIYQLED